MARAGGQQKRKGRGKVISLKKRGGGRGDERMLKEESQSRKVLPCLKERQNVSANFLFCSPPPHN